MTAEEVIDKLRNRRVFVKLKPNGELSVRAMPVESYTEGAAKLVDAYRTKIVDYLRSQPGAPGNPDDKRRIDWLIDYHNGIHRLAKDGDPAKVNLGQMLASDGRTWHITETVLRLVDQDTVPGTSAHATRMAELAAFHDAMNGVGWPKNPFDESEPNGANGSQSAGGVDAMTTEPSYTMSSAEADG